MRQPPEVVLHLDKVARHGALAGPAMCGLRRWNRRKRRTVSKPAPETELDTRKGQVRRAHGIVIGCLDTVRFARWARPGDFGCGGVGVRSPVQEQESIVRLATVADSIFSFWETRRLV